MSAVTAITACAATALLLAAATLVSRWRAPVGADEGYLWYGTLRLLEGRVPVRDFRSYEPGRYLWCAPFVHLLGRGVLGVRIATHAFFAVGLAAALLALYGLGFSLLGLGLTAILLVAWAFPQHKLFEPGTALLNFAGLAWLAMHPTPATAFVAGMGVGLISLFGVNLALYASAAFAVQFGLLLVTGVLADQAWPLLAAACAGGVAGAAPMLGFAAFAPGFARALVERRGLAVLARGRTNLPLPIPMPWRAPPPQLSALAPWRRWAVGWLFAALPTLPLAALLATVVITVTVGGAPVSPWPAIGAASSLGIGAWHHAYSRADVSHLAQAIVSLLLLIAVVLELGLGLGALLVAAGGGSFALVWPCFRPGRPQGKAGAPSLRPVQGWALRLSARETAVLDTLEPLARRELADGGHLLALPTLAWVYPALGCISPVHDLFCVYHATEEEQQRMILEIKASDVRLVLISVAPLDGKPERAFPATHPRVMGYLHEHFDPVDAQLPRDLLLLCTRARVQAPAAERA